MKTYSLATRPKLESMAEIDIAAPSALPDLPLMTIQQARKACEIARANGHDVIVFNTAAE